MATGKKGSAQDFLTNEYTRGSRKSDDYAFDVWSDGRAVIVVACCADKFDEDGYPVASSLLDGHAYAWILPLGYSDYTGGLTAFGDQFFARERSACNLDAALNHRGLSDPRIEWAKVTYEGSNEAYAAAVELYGFAERVDDGSGKKGYACFEYTGGRNFHLMSDMAIQNALGDDHQRVNLRSSVRGHDGAIDAVNRFRCFGFVALSQPKEGAAGELASNAAFANAVSSGMIANAVDAGKPVAMDSGYHDIEISHRVYADGDGNDLLDIVISNYADTDDSFKLSCQAYLDGDEKPLIVSLPYYEKALASRTTHTITLPVSALVGDPGEHISAWVEISAIGRDENAYANNEFAVYLGGGNPLHFIRQPEDATVQEGEDVSFEVEVGGGRQPYGYQWQIWDEKHQKWVDIPGFTGPTLSRKDIEKKWDGCKFRCVVTDANGTQIISQVVTLTVRDRVPTGDNSNLPLYLAVAVAAVIALIAMRRRYRRG